MRSLLLLLLQKHPGSLRQMLSSRLLPGGVAASCLSCGRQDAHRDAAASARNALLQGPCKGDVCHIIALLLLMHTQYLITDQANAYSDIASHVSPVLSA